MPGPDVDLAIVGGGLAGSLALTRITASRWAKDHSIALLDRQPDPLDGRAWAYWSPEPVVPGCDGSVWSRLRLRAERQRLEVRLSDVHYRRLSGDRLGRHLRDLTRRPGVRRLVAEVTAVEQADDAAEVHLEDGSLLRAKFVLDSTRSLPARADAPVLEFLGYRLPSGPPLPEADLVTLMDLRVPQRGGVRFVYTIPGRTGGGLVEITSFLPRGGRDGDLLPDLRSWLAAAVGTTGAQVATPAEAGHYPLVRTGRRRLSRSVMLTGLGAGCIRPATGYGVMHMARDAAAMAASLDRRGHPFVRHPLTTRERWIDRVFLRAMRENPGVVREAYLAMFEQAGGDEVLRFLNGEITPRRLAAIAGAMPKGPFLRSAFGLPR